MVPCTWSDHNAVMTTFSSFVPRPSHRTWYKNDSLLANSSHWREIKNAFKDYLTNNASLDTNPLTLWEAHKSFIRGVCISQASHQHGVKRQLHKRLEEAFYKASETFQTSPSPSTKQIFWTRLELYLFLTDSAEKILRKSKPTPLFFLHEFEETVYISGPSTSQGGLHPKANLTKINQRYLP